MLCCKLHRSLFIIFHKKSFLQLLANPFFNPSRLQSVKKNEETARREIDQLKSENRSLKDKFSDLARESESDKLKLQKAEKDMKKEGQVSGFSFSMITLIG